jgi:hypothetical protein
VFIHDDDAWLQRHCSVGRLLHTQLPLDSQVWRRWQLAIAELCTIEAIAARAKKWT